LRPNASQAKGASDEVAFFELEKATLRGVRTVMKAAHLRNRED
jgi:hypothetical protein